MLQFPVGTAELVVPLLAAGAVSGLVAGFFGVGGGLIMVPILFQTLTTLGHGAAAIHTAVGTSLAVIVASSIRSTIAHNGHGAVDVGMLRQWIGWLFAGALAGGIAASHASGRFLTGFFGAVTILVSLLFIAARPAAGRARGRRIPPGPARAAIGGGIGAVSALMGIGGGVFGVPVLVACGLPVHRAVGTSAAFGAAIGIPGTVSYLVAGWDRAALAPGSLGYVNLPGWLVMTAGALLLVPVGARLAHRTPGLTLRRLFGLLLAVNGAYMLSKALG